MKKIILGIIMATGGVILMSQNTFAEWVQQSSTYVDSRSYVLDIQNGNLVTDNNFGSRTIPFNILSHIEGENRGLQELTLFQSVNDTSDDKFKSVMMDITLKQYRQSEQQTTINHILPEEMGFTVTTNKGNVYGNCVENETGFDYIQYRCLANAPDNAKITGVYMRVGDKNSWNKGQSWYYYLGVIAAYNLTATNNINPIQISYVSLNITTTADPAVSLLQQQINQNSQIISGIKDINDTITDSNVSGNFNLSAIQPFGPIATITNNILSLPLILVGVGTCNDVVAPLPYINEDLIIECPHKWLPQMAGQFYNMADGIFSAGLYFLLARYIFKKVQNLRDPNNDDEEYLDI